MTYKARFDKAVIIGVLIAGLILSYGLQRFIWNASEKEASYEFESQTSNLTLFIIDDFKNLIDEFKVFAASAGHISATLPADQLVPALEDVLLKNYKPIFFSVYRQVGEQLFQADASWQHRYYFGDQVEPEIKQAVVQQAGAADRYELRSYFFDLPSIGYSVCLVKNISPAEADSQFMTACFELRALLDPVLLRSSYDWLDIYLYSGSVISGYQQVYSFSETGEARSVNPRDPGGTRSILLPRVIEAAGHQLSVLFVAREDHISFQWLRYLPVSFGLLLTILIALYLFSVQRRNAEINRQVEQKTQELMKAKVKLEIEVENKGYLYKKIKTSVANLEAVTNSVNGVIWEANPETMEYTYISSQVTQILGFMPEEYLSGERKLGGQQVPDGQLAISYLIQQRIAGPDNFTLEYQGYRKDGELIWIRNIISKVFDGDNLLRIRGVFLDITEEKKLSEDRAEMESQLKHAQKMEAIGQLAAGIAHEINTPSQFVGDNLSFIQESVADCFTYIGTLEALIGTGDDEVVRKLNAAKEAADIEFIAEEIPQAVEQSIDGVKRIAKIVSAMKEFSHPGLENKQKIDLNHAIESTVVVARNEWKYLAEMHLNMSDDLPMVNCYPGEINQIILNMIVNSAHAIEEKTGGDAKGNITITTRAGDDEVIIEIADDGVGMEDTVRHRIFEHFFTTKDVGKGTGQGLSIAYSVIVEKHNGTLAVDSQPGDGSCFTITLPLR